MQTSKTIAAARRNMRDWAMRLREATACGDKIGQMIARQRAILWRETSNTLTHQAR